MRVGDQWVSFQTMQPISVQAALIANAHESWLAKRDEGVVDAAASALFRSADSVLDQSFLSGLFDLLQAISRAEVQGTESGLRTIARTAHSLTPFAGFQRTVRDAMDDTQRQPDTAGEAFLANVPRLSGRVPPRLDRFGQDVVREGGPARRALDPLGVSSVKRDPIAEEVERLGVALNLPTGRLNLPGGRELSRDEELELRQREGRLVREALERVINARSYRYRPDRAREPVLTATVKAARERARNEFRRDVLRRTPSASRR